ncbi:uncharacterized protein LOC144819025 [Lissotriton helveticus]
MEGPTVTRLGICHQRAEVHSDSNAIDGILGVSGKLEAGSITITIEEESSYQEGVEESACLTDHILEDVGPNGGAPGHINSGDLPRTLTLQGASAFEDSTFAQGSGICRADLDFQRGTDRDGLVAGKHGCLEWQGLFLSQSGDSHRIGCQQMGLGSPLQFNGDWGALVPGGTGTPYQLPRAPCRLICNSDSLPATNKLLYSTADGQCVSSTIHQSSRGNTISYSGRESQGLLALLPDPSYIGDGGIYSGFFQCGSGLELLFSEGCQRLDTAARGVQAVERQMGSMFSGSICIQTQCTTSSVLQLASRPPGNQLGCVPSVMDDGHSICISTFCHDSESIVATPSAEGGGDSSHTALESASVVSGGANIVMRTSGTTTVVSKDSGGPSRVASPTGVAGPLISHDLETLGDEGKCLEFHRRLSFSYHNCGHLLRTNGMCQRGVDGLVSVLNGKQIPWDPVSIS